MPAVCFRSQQIFIFILEGDLFMDSRFRFPIPAFDSTLVVDLPPFSIAAAPSPALTLESRLCFLLYLSSRTPRDWKHSKSLFRYHPPYFRPCADALAWRATERYCRPSCKAAVVRIRWRLGTRSLFLQSKPQSLLPLCRR